MGKHAHNEYVRKYQERCSKEGLGFTSMIVDTFKAWHPAALEILSKLGRQLARVAGREENGNESHLRQRLAVVLVRDNMNMLLGRTPVKTGQF